MSFITRMLFDSEIARIWAAIKRVQLASPLPNSSVERGAVEIRSAEGLIVDGSAIVNGVERITGSWYLEGIGWVTGTLNIDGLLSIGGTLNVDGTSTFNGDSRFVGSLDIDGPVDVNGPSKFIGSVRIEGALDVIGNVVFTGLSTFDGDVKITKDLDVTALTRLRGPVTLETKLEIEGGGHIELGDLRIEAGGSGGQIRFAASTIQGTSAGLLFNGNGGLLRLGHDQIALQDSGGSAMVLRDGTVGFGGVATLTDIDVPGFAWIAQLGDGTIRRVPNDVGSPLGGDLRWPFDPALISDGFGPRVSPGGIGSSEHRGCDFTLPQGTPIPSAGNGTVTFSGGNAATGFGYHVIIDHGKGINTLYAHQDVPSPLVVGQRVIAGQAVGVVGTTGTSTGFHLHFEVHRDGEPIDPEGFITAPWEPWS